MGRKYQLAMTLQKGQSVSCMKKITFLKPLSKPDGFTTSKREQTQKLIRKKQLSNYMDFLKRESPYFKNGVPTDFDHMDKTFMMTHFNELTLKASIEMRLQHQLLRVKRLVTSPNLKVKQLLVYLQEHRDIVASSSRLRKSEACGRQLFQLRCCQRVIFLATELPFPESRQ